MVEGTGTDPNLNPKSGPKSNMGQLYRNVPIGLCSFDIDLRLVDVNDWLADRSGKSREALLECSIVDFLPAIASDVADVVGILRHVIASGESVLAKKFAVKVPDDPDRETVFQHSYVPIHASDGIIVGVSAVIEDITQQKIAANEARHNESPLRDHGGISQDVTENRRTADELQETTNLLRTIMDNVPIAISYRGMDGRFIYVNEVGARSLGFSPEELFDTKFAISSDDLAQQVIRTGQPIRNYTYHPSRVPDQERQGDVVPVHDVHGQMAGVVTVIQDVSVLRKTEADFQRLRTAVENIPDVISIYDPDSRLVYANRALIPQELAPGGTLRNGMTYREIMHQIATSRLVLGVTDNIEEWVEERVDEFHNSRGPNKYYRKDGAIFLAYRHRLKDGSTLTISHDITETEAAQGALLETEERYRDLVEGSLQGVIVHRDQKPLYANDALIQMFGYDDLEDFMRIGSISALAYDDDVARVESRAQQRRDGEDVSNFAEFRGIRKDGSLIWFATSGRRTQWQGAPAIQATVMETTERKEAELAIERSETKFRALFDNAQAGSVVIDKAGTILSFNNAASVLFDYQAHEVMGRNVAMLMPAAEGRQHDGYLTNYLKSGEGQIIGKGREVIGQQKNGDEFPMHLSIGVIGSGPEAEFVGSIVDLTGLRKLENQLHQSQKMEAIGNLTGGIAHDFNNMLGITKGNLELLRRRVSLNDRDLNYLNEGLDAVNRAAALTHRLLAFSRQQPLQPHPSDIGEIIRGMENLLRRTISRNIALKILLSPMVGTVLVDPQQFENALLNLVLNSRDAMPTGGEITIQSEILTIESEGFDLGRPSEPGEYLCLTIVDTGVGMSAADIQKAFDPFFTTKPFGRGSGLGLSMVHGFVNQSGGHVTIESEVNVGTIVHMYLPLVESAMVSGDRQDNQQSESATNIGLGRTVLVVEDNPDLRLLATEAMSSFGFAVLQANDGQAAKEILDTGSGAGPDLLFTDIVLPGAINGHELAVLARSKYANIRVLLCSGYDHEGGAIAQKSMSDMSFIAKPYGINDLAQAIERLLQNG
ncbi:MAG: PAS domain S-box protein [Rhodospirillaceae bacterium]|nr:PAS domain S-box protein [Rhodospirillaceae bacterium]MBT6985759.1 PAS domain S-box protein [Rhodospirillaceae bacterium]